MRIVIPPLRERRADIPSLARHFLWEAGCVEPDAVLSPPVLERLVTQSWRGNVRELRNALQRAVLLSDADAALAAPADVEPPTPPAADGLRSLLGELLTQHYHRGKDELLDTFDRLYACGLKERHGSNISGMAREAGVDRQVVRRLLQKLEP